jgi:hypothetical protein
MLRPNRDGLVKLHASQIAKIKPAQCDRQSFMSGAPLAEGSAMADFPAPSLPLLPDARFWRTLKGMDVHLENPELQAKLDRWVTETGRGPDELVEDAMAGYFDELTRTREMLDSRYDDLKSGTVQPIDGEEFFESLRRREDELLKKQ